MKNNQVAFEFDDKRYELTVKSRISIAEERYLVEQCAEAYFDANGNYDPGYGQIIEGVLLFIAYTDVWDREFGKEDAESGVPQMTGERLNRLCEIMDAMHECEDNDVFEVDYQWRSQYRRIVSAIQSKVSARLKEHPFKHTAELLNALLQSIVASFETAQSETSQYVQELLDKAGGLEGLYKKIRGGEDPQQKESAKIVAMPDVHTDQEE